jgi:hypothetical protein
MFVLDCNLTPVMKRPQSEKWVDGCATVWVWTDSEDRVHAAACSYMYNRGWIIDKVYSIHEISLESAMSAMGDEIHLEYDSSHNQVAAEISCFER